MSQDWMIDVLQDLRRFSGENGLPGLAEHLDDAIFIAVAEITAKARDSAMMDPYAQPDSSVSGTRGVM